MQKSNISTRQRYYNNSWNFTIWLHMCGYNHRV